MKLYRIDVYPYFTKIQKNFRKRISMKIHNHISVQSRSPKIELDFLSRVIRNRLDFSTFRLSTFPYKVMLANG